MEICWQDANFGLREEIVSRLYCSLPAPHCKRNDRNTYYLRLKRAHKLMLKIWG